MLLRSTTLSLLLCAFLLALPRPSTAQLRLAQVIGDGMVMQRDAAVPVWGWADAGSTVTVTFDGRTYTARADGGGAWRVTLPPMNAGGPHAMTVSNNGDEVQVRDILAGDVWIASGQSNMAWPVARSNNAEAEIAAARDRQIRHFTVPRSWAIKPEATLAGGSWAVTDPATVGEFSAVAYFFARALRESVDVPIGIINTSWGGSRIEPWMSLESLDLDEAAREAVLLEERAVEGRVLDALRARIGDLPRQDAGLVDGAARWAAPAMDDAAWDTLSVPAPWEQAGFDGLDGVGWYRTAFELTPAEARAGGRLSLGPIDDSDVTWVNGVQVGRMDNASNVAREYDLPAAVLRPGRNVVAVRVEDTGGDGGINGQPGQVFIEAGGRRQPLARPWRFKVGAVTTVEGGRKHHTPTLLYNKMIHPLLPYPIKGALWYQGESNANAGDAYAYRDLFATMIRDWRARWGVGDFPFLFVQLANYMAPDDEPTESFWAVLRESQSDVLRLPNTAQAIAIDLGEAGDIHPRNKQDVGRRLALAARKMAYGEELVYSGPVYRSHAMMEGRVRLTFDHVGGGLKARDGGDRVEGFAVAGSDGRFVWAEAAITGDQVVVWSEQVPNPVAVRYAWGNNPDRAGLYNAEGLPAQPFRTDR